MNIDELNKLIKSSSAVVVMENSEPSFVVMNFQTYKNLTSGESKDESKQNIKISNSTDSSFTVNTRVSSKEGELEILDRINKEILALKDEIEREEKSIFALD